MTIIDHPPSATRSARPRNWQTFPLLIFILLSIFFAHQWWQTARNNACRQPTLTICTALADGLPQPEIIKGQGQLDEKHQSILLLGERENHTFPRLSFYESVGVFTLDSGSWSLSANGIGGHEDTGASAISLSWNAAPQSCLEQPDGSWANAFRVNCEVRFEWTIQSRYPYTALQLMPIESLIPSPEGS